MMKRLLAPAFLGTLLALVSPAFAQYAAGDVLFGDWRNIGLNYPVFGVTPRGSVYTVTYSLSVRPWTLAPSPDNRSVWVSGIPGTQSIAPDGTVTTLQYSGSSFPRVFYAAIDVDDRGHAILPNSYRPFIAEYAGGAFATLCWGPLDTQTGAIDLVSGDLVVEDWRAICRINLVGNPQMMTVTTAVPAHSWGGLHADPAAGALIAGWGDHIHRLVLGPPSTLGWLRSLPGMLSLDRDPTSGTFVILRYTASAAGELVRYDSVTNTVMSIAGLGTSRPLRFTIAGSRHLAAVNTPTVGQSYRLRVSFPNEPGTSYVVGASLGMRGIPLQPGRTVYLTPDALFHFSLTNSGIFSGFQGLLDARGEAIATMLIPNSPALRGAHFYVAAVTSSPFGFSGISDPIGVTIR